MINPNVSALAMTVDLVRSIQNLTKSQSRRPVLAGSNRCPFGTEGSIHWIREPVKVKSVTLSDQDQPQFIRLQYLSDNKLSKLITYPSRLKWIPKVDHGFPNGCLYEGARLFVQVTKIWRHKLLDISEGDAENEGPPPNWCGVSDCWDPLVHGYLTQKQLKLPERLWDHPDLCYHVAAKESFLSLWDSIPLYKSTKRTSQYNPEVWAAKFKLVKYSI